MRNTAKEMTTAEIGRLYSVSANTVKKWISEGKFPTAHKVRDRGGDTWVINVDDPGIDSDIKDIRRRTIEKKFGPQPSGDGVQNLVMAVQELINAIREQSEILREVAKALKK